MDSIYDYRYERRKAVMVDTCKECRYEIYEGEEYYDINGLILCDQCNSYFKKIGGEDQ